MKTLKSTITPQAAVQILKANGTEVTLDEAELILNVLKILANLAVSQYIKKEYL